MTLLRSFAAALVAFAAVGPATAGEFTDPERRFHLTAPDGWVSQRSPGEPIALVIASPRVGETRGNCNVFAGKNDQTGKSQAEVDKYAEEVVNNEAFWKGALGSVKIFKSTTIEKFGARDADGRKVFFMRATSNADLNGVAITVTQLQDMHPMPGTTYAITCTALTDKFDREEADFAAIMNSFKPSIGLTVSWDMRPMNLRALRHDSGRAVHFGTAAGTLRAAGRR